MAKRSAGILLYRGSGDGLELLLAHPGGPFWTKRDLGAWSIPKGECEEGEDLCACALREFGEELGPAPALAESDLIELGEVRQKSGKYVHAWGAVGEFDPADLDSNTFALEWPPRSGSEREFPEVDRVEWFTPDAAREKILAAQSAFIDRLLEALRIR